MSLIKDIGNFFTGGLWGGISDIIGGVGQHSANQQAQENFNRNLAWQKEMATTAMQKRVEDLKRAGLNPMLAVGGMGAAQAGGGSSIPEMKSPAGTAATVRMNQMMAQNAMADIDLKRSQAELNRAQIPKVSQDITESGSRVEINKRMIDKLIEETNLARVSAYTQSALREKLYEEINEISARIENLNSDTTLKEANKAESVARQVEAYAKASLTKLTEVEKRGLLQAMWELATNEAYRSKLGLKKAENMADAEWSTWKQVFGPYLPDMASIAAATGTTWFLSRLGKGD